MRTKRNKKNLATTYSPTDELQYHRRKVVSLPCSGWERVLQYHRRKVVSLPCSGWERVFPTCYGHQAFVVCKNQKLASIHFLKFFSPNFYKPSLRQKNVFHPTKKSPIISSFGYFSFRLEDGDSRRQRLKVQADITPDICNFSETESNFTPILREK